MGSLSYSLGRFVSQRPALSIGAFGFAVASAIYAIQPQSDSKTVARSPREAAQVTGTQTLPPPKPVTVQKCENEKAARMAEYQALLKKGDPWKAATAIRACSVILEDAELQSLVKQAEHQDLVNTALNRKATGLERLNALDRLESEGQTDQKLKGIRTQITSQIQTEERRQKQAIAAEKRKRGVSVGMSKDDVLASSWGRPERINKTVNSYGVHEQWVYGGRNYLYFDDGVLSSIQTGE